MEKHGAIPEGYMTVGQLAKKMGITVRTLQHYDQINVFSPSGQSEGGRRLYTDQDLIRLHQILSLKHLGFSLDDIKSRIISLDCPNDVADILTQQATDVRRKIDALSESLREIEMLKAEVLQMQSVDFKKYADIIVNLQMKNSSYWLIKHFDDQTLDHIRSRFDKESGLAFMNHFTELTSEILSLLQNGVSPTSETGQCIAKQFWEMIMDFTNGDLTLLPKLTEIGRFDNTQNEWEQKQALVNSFIGPALDNYLEKLGINPFEEESR